MIFTLGTFILIQAGLNQDFSASTCPTCSSCCSFPLFKSSSTSSINLNWLLAISKLIRGLLISKHEIFAVKTNYAKELRVALATYVG